MSLGTLLFVLAFLVIGLAVVLAAMRSGRRTRERSPGQRRTSDRLMGLAIGLGILVIGLGIPALVIVSNSESKAKDGPGGLELTDAQADARQVFAIKCGNCHTLAAANAVGKVGPNLDTMRPPKELVINAIEQGRARGMGQMPANIVTGEEAEHVAEYVGAVAGR